jgi:hypothetical protein
MCDCSLEHFVPRPAKVGDMLVTTKFTADLGDAVALEQGGELARDMLGAERRLAFA